MHDQGYDKYDQEEKEQNFGDSGGSECDASEPKEPGNQSYYQGHQSVVKHFVPPEPIEN
jgi:hypothetical protein